MKIILKINGSDIIGSDSLFYVDGRLTLSNMISKVIERNNSFKKNFPHKIADSFYFVDDRMKRISQDIRIN